jgi:hypothetical protein
VVIDPACRPRALTRRPVDREAAMGNEDAIDQVARDMSLATLHAYGNLVGALASAATGAGLPASLVLDVVDRLDRMNANRMPSHIADLFTLELDLTRALLHKRGGRPSPPGDD